MINATPSHAPLHLRWLRFAPVQKFYRLAGRLLPWCWAASVLFFAAGLAAGLLPVPAAVQQVDANRIALAHLPTAWTSVLIFVAMAFWSGAGLMTNTRLPFLLVAALAPTGVVMTVLALWTGALWGKPIWGAWWVWDARLTSGLLLLLLYVGFLILQATVSEPRRGDRAGALLTLLGAVNVPVIYFSVHWWNTLHSAAAASVAHTPFVADTMRAGVILMSAACFSWSLAATLHRVRSLILEREAGAP